MNWPMCRYSQARTAFVLFVLATAIPLGAPAGAAAADRSVAAAGIFQPLKVGQKVTMHDRGTWGIEIQLLNDGAIGTHTVIEVSTAHIVVEDIVAVSRHWIPVSAIREVVWTRIPESGGKAPVR
jgi:hypothetical protein